MGYDYYIDAPTIHRSDLLHPHVSKVEESLPEQFLRSAVYAGLQQPINGVVQMVDKTTGAHLLPKLQFIDPCQKSDFGTVSWHVQQFGAMLGVTGDLLALNKGVGRTSNLLAGRIENTAENQGALALRTISDAAATGFIHNGLFRPVSSDEGNFYAARLKNALVGAGTFATGAASTLGVKYLAQGRENMFGNFLRSNVGSTVVSGIPGGFAYAEMKSLADGHGFASGKSIGQAVYSFSVLGGAFAAGKGLFGTTSAEERLNAIMKTKADEARALNNPGSAKPSPEEPLTEIAKNPTAEPGKTVPVETGIKAVAETGKAPSSDAVKPPALEPVKAAEPEGTPTQLSSTDAKPPLEASKAEAADALKAPAAIVDTMSLTKTGLKAS